MYDRTLRNAEHTRSFTIRPTDGGWEVREQHDQHITRRVHYTDWHRVERAQRTFAIAAATLRDAGWTDI
jgi:hypothetical protein